MKRYISESLEDFINRPALLEKVTLDSAGIPEDDEDYEESEDEESEGEETEEELYNDYEEEVFNYIHDNMNLEKDLAYEYFELLTDKYSQKLHDLFDVDVSPEDAAIQLFNDDEIKQDLNL